MASETDQHRREGENVAKDAIIEQGTLTEFRSYFRCGSCQDGNRVYSHGVGLALAGHLSISAIAWHTSIGYDGSIGQPWF